MSKATHSPASQSKLTAARSEKAPHPELVEGPLITPVPSFRFLKFIPKCPYLDAIRICPRFRSFFRRSATKTSYRMNISISRDGTEIGEWTEDEVRAFFAEGRLVATDFYWKEGMAEWQPLNTFIKPPPPFPKLVTSPATVDIAPSQNSQYLTVSSLSIQNPPSSPVVAVNVKAEGLNRLQYAGAIIGWWAAYFLIYLLFSYNYKGQVPDSDSGALTGFGIIVILVLCAYRLKNIGVKTWFWVFMLIPIANIFIFLLCLFASPNSGKKTSFAKTLGQLR
jgi:hypothetical protein